MDLFETHKQKSICNEDICESCGYAEFDSSDSDYCSIEYVSDCAYPTNGREFAENIIEEMEDYRTQKLRGYCPFYIPRFLRESESLRCPSCNSPLWEDVPDSCNCESMTEKLKCVHCGEIRTESIERVAYAYCPQNDQLDRSV